LPLIERKARLAALLTGVDSPLQYSDHHRGRGDEFHAQACKLRLEGIVSKRAVAPYAPGNRGIWVKTKCLNRGGIRDRRLDRSPVKTARDQYFLKPVVKYMPRRARHLCPAHDQIVLPIALAPHRHVGKSCCPPVTQNQ
jgi:hypothetical protein